MQDVIEVKEELLFHSFRVPIVRAMVREEDVDVILASVPTWNSALCNYQLPQIERPTRHKLRRGHLRVLMYNYSHQAQHRRGIPVGRPGYVGLALYFFKK